MARSAGLAASQAVQDRWKRRFVELPKERLQLAAQHLDHPAQQRLLPEVSKAKARVAIRDLDRDVRLLCAGREVLREHRPALAAPLFGWIDRERELAERVVAVARGQKDRLPEDQYQSAIRAGRLGTLLEREKSGPETPLPGALAAFGPEVHRASVRLRAFGFPDPFPRETLEALSPKRLATVLGEIRSSGILRDGSAWTLRGKTAHDLSQRLMPALAAEVRREKGLGS
jgi:hypothetical protein